MLTFLFFVIIAIVVSDAARVVGGERYFICCDGLIGGVLVCIEGDGRYSSVCTRII